MRPDDFGKFIADETEKCREVTGLFTSSPIMDDRRHAVRG
jgi:hypothetical protein